MSRSIAPGADVNSVIHGHPLYGTALGATDATLEFLTHDAVLFTDGLGIYDEGPALVTEASQGRQVAAALGDATGLPAAQPRRGHRRRGRPLGRAHRGHPGAGRALPVHLPASLGDRTAHPGRARRPCSDPRNTRTASWTSTGRPGCGASTGPGCRCGRRADDACLAGAQRPGHVHRRRAPGAAARRAPRAAGPDRRQALLRRPGVRHLHRARGRAAGELLHLPRARDRRPGRADHRRAPGDCPAFEAITRRLRASCGGPVRLLHAGHGAHHPRPAGRPAR